MDGNKAMDCHGYYTSQDFYMQDKFSSLHFLVIGDLMLDSYIWGNVSRISPEAPVPIFLQSSRDYRLGGAGNVVRALRALGSNVSIASIVGDDQDGNILSDLLEAESLVNINLFIDSSRPTTVKNRFIAQGQQIMRLDRETNKELSPQASDKLMCFFDSMINSLHGVILSDYAKGCLSHNLCSYIIEKCNANGITVFVDPKSRSFEKYRGASWLTPNKGELSLASGFSDLSCDEEITKACRHLISQFGINGILATRSENGMSLITDSKSDHIKTEAKEVFDVSGAGDTAIAAFALAFVASSGNDSLAMRFSNMAAGIVVGKSGTATVTIDEIKEAYIRSMDIYGSKIFSCDDLHLLIDKLREKGASIGFSNGCFDILHPGHVSLLKAARKECDFLIVAVNSDLSVKRLKGADRPVHNISHRTSVLEALACVDAVVVFEEDTPLNLINFLKPDILFKGSDYSIDQVVGSDEVQSWGGKVCLLDLIEGYSTTNTVEKLKNARVA